MKTVYDVWVEGEIVVSTKSLRKALREAVATQLARQDRVEVSFAHAKGETVVACIDASGVREIER